MTRVDQPASDSHGEASGATGRRTHRALGDRPTAVEFRRFLGRTFIGTLIPGTGLIAAGRRRSGVAILTVFLLGVAAAITFVVQSGRAGVIDLGSDPDRLYVVAWGLLATAVVWLLTAVTSFYLLEPRHLRVPQRLLGVAVLVVAATLVLTPLSLGSRYAYTTSEVVGDVFVDEDEQHSLTVPEDATEKDPWAGKSRVNVLILGADSGADRDGTRTDTVMVASINTETGDTALFSLPRNMQYMPFPEGPMRDAYPDGYHGDEDSEYWLFAMYKNVPAEFPEVFEGIPDPGAEALKLSVGEALGLDIDYYVMANLRGFQSLVNALGGIDIDVPYRIPIGTRAIQGVGCTKATGWIEPGANQHLDGYHALWFARARCGPGPVNDDYERMRRQRCVIGAIAQQADPFNLLVRYQQLARVAQDNMSTDIGRQRLADFAELALRVQKSGSIRSLPFTNQIVDYGDPDYDLIRTFVDESLAAPESEPSAPSSDPAASTSPDDSPDGDSPDDSPDGDRSDRPAGEASPDGTDASDDSPAPVESATPNESEGAQSIDEVC
jgi:LCP family protein required for cell wall assembly